MADKPHGRDPDASLTFLGWLLSLIAVNNRGPPRNRNGTRAQPGAVSFCVPPGPFRTVRSSHEPYSR